MSEAGLPDPDGSYALLVGVHRYKSLEDLPAVEQNLTALRDLLCAPDVWGLPPSHATVCSQPDDATHVLETLETVASRAVDTLLVYYAGHGLVDPADEDLNLALAGSDGNRVHSTSVPFAWVRREILRPEVRARHKVVILDCCWSGRAMAGWMGADREVGDEVANRARIKGACLLTSVAETKKALAPPGEEFTAFTGELISVLRDGVPDGPELLDLETLYRETHTRLAAKDRPLPRIRSLNLGGRISLARNRALRPPPDTAPSALSPPAHGALPRARREPAPGEPYDTPNGGPYGPAHGTAHGEPAEPAGDAPVRIGLWGAPASGKTTLLAALAHVVGDTQQGYGSWRVGGLDRVAEEFLVRHKETLLDGSRFPAATEAVGEPLRFRFSGDTGGSSGFVVEVQDVPGHYFRDRRPADDGAVTRRLAESDGLVFLFDPTAAAAHAGADYLFGIIQRITTYLEESGRPPGRHLPHGLAVCVTKFDAPQVFLAARAARWGTQGDDRYRFPRVKDSHARGFFRWAAAHFAGADGSRLCDLIEHHFDPDRTRYFATTSIGFHVGADGLFDAADFANTTAGGIRGPIRPVNVLEPFIALRRTLRGSGVRG